MKIALFGYGKMGKLIEQTALQRGHAIAVKIDKEPVEIPFSKIDVAIDFSTPEAAFENITTCMDQGIPIVSGTTGWLDRFPEIVEICNTRKGAFVYASNFSLGVNLFFKLNEQLAKMMASYKQYRPNIEETHHTQKLDSPSGTAITLAEGIIAHSENDRWSMGSADTTSVSVTSVREGNVPGTHSISYESNIDTIRITHEAHNREGFALGAVVAAEWILGKTGVFTMNDVLNLG